LTRGQLTGAAALGDLIEPDKARPCERELRGDEKAGTKYKGHRNREL
jgi:hypothetical protein